MEKEFYGLLSIIFTLATYIPYMWSTIQGTTRPHIFSWSIWALSMSIASAGQFAGNAEAGWWSTGLSALSAIIIVLLSLKNGKKDITRFDIIIFVSALCAIPLWMITQNPLSAIILITIIDLLAYLPTFRKSYYKPHEEMWFSYFVSNLKHFASFFAMTTYSFTTMLFPVALFLGNFALIAMIIIRRRVTIIAKL